MFRNIIEHSYPKEVESRKSAMAEADHKLLAKFTAAKDRDTRSRALENRNANQEMRRVVTTLLLLFAVVIALLVSEI